MRRTLILLALASHLVAQERLGTLVFPNSGKPEAQQAFIRGVAALHNFWYDEAAESFREAERIDPNFALAYWGEAMTYDHPIWHEHDAAGGIAAVKKITAPPADARERMYVDAAHALFENGDYESAMRKLAHSYPDDVEAQTFYALAILGTMHHDAGDERKQIRAAAILEPLLPSHPDHPGVLHYMIHAYDDPIHAPLGERAARRYARVAAAAPYALHMPSHIFLQLGMWDDAARSNEQAYAASKEWVTRKKMPSSKRDLHSLSWLQYVYLQQHRFDDAKKLIDEANGDSEHEKMIADRMHARYAIETGDLSALATLAKTLPHGTDRDAKIAEATSLEAKALEAKSMDESLALLAKAVALEDAIGAPSGPPEIFKPAHELYGEMLLKAGRAKEARAQLEESLLRTPGRRLTVEALARVSAASGSTARPTASPDRIPAGR